MMTDDQKSPADEDLVLGLLKAKSAKVRPDEEFRKTMLNRVRQWSISGGTPTGSRFWSFTRIWIGATCAFLIAVTGVASYSYASPYVGRDNKLYFLKRFVETVELRTAVTPVKQAETYLKFSDRRSDEAEIKRQKGVVDIPTIKEMTDDLSEAAEKTKELPEKDRKSLRNRLDERVKKEKKNISEIIEDIDENESPPRAGELNLRQETAPAPMMFSLPALTPESSSAGKGVERSEDGVRLKSGTGALVPASTGSILPSRDSEDVKDLKKQLQKLKKVEDQLNAED